MIVYTPLDLPIIEPDDWEKFWEVWKSKAGPVVKVKKNWAGSLTPVNSADLWDGIDIFSLNNSAAWTAPEVDIRDVLPNFYNKLVSLIPGISRVRLVSSKLPFGAHSDDNLDTWVIRGFLCPKNFSKWYFTRPQDPKGQRSYILLPEDTMWFAYNDKHCWHGTEYDSDNKKILIQLTFSADIKDILHRSMEKYKDYTINYE